MDKKENLCFEMSTQSSDLKLTEMLWHDRKKAFWSRHPEIFMSTAEQFCSEKWLKIPPCHCLTLIISYKKQMMAILLLKKVKKKKTHFLQIALQLLDVFTEEQLFVLQVYSYYISL